GALKFLENGKAIDTTWTPAAGSLSTATVTAPLGAGAHVLQLSYNATPDRKETERLSAPFAVLVPGNQPPRPKVNLVANGLYARGVAPGSGVVNVYGNDYFLHLSGVALSPTDSLQFRVFGKDNLALTEPVGSTSPTRDGQG